ncbi:ATP-binding protein [bacterium]|nr:ATP-binding protein [bacterium]
MPPAPHRHDMKISNETRNLALVRQAASDFLEKTPFGRKDKDKIILAVDEAVANVVEHAYGTQKGDIEVVFNGDTERLEITIRDNGKRFNPEEIAAPDIHDHIKKGLKGGLGMFLMRKIMDEVRYSVDSTHVNELVMVKFYPQGGSAP